VRDLVIPEEPATIEPLLRQPLIVPTQASVGALLSEMRKHRNHFAIAVDEYGGTDGIITLEDVLEEIVGEVQDECEQEPPAVQRLSGDRIRVGGLSSVDVIEELLGVGLQAGHSKTVAGYIVERVGRIAEIGESVEIEGYRLTVIEVDGLRIAAVEVTRTSVDPSPRRTTE